MKSYGRGNIAEFLGDRIVYRNLEPVDARLPPFSSLQRQLGLPAGRIPRKSEPAYARVIVQLLAAAQVLDRADAPLERLVFLGDTRMNDGTAFANLCRESGWPGLAFIGAEDREPPRFEPETLGEGVTLFQANRWAALAEFDAYCRSHGFAVNAETAVIVDLDKTALGARGRNAGVIDRVRLQAVSDTVAGYLRDDFDQEAFQRAYDELNQVGYHHFTGDNQDYLAYISLILGSGLYALETLLAAQATGEIRTFADFIAQVDSRLDELPEELQELHQGIYARVQAGDPTPFKAFRRREYVVTIDHMGQLPDQAPVEKLLAEEITLTAEVRAQALAWKAQGALLFGLSDKPDEASLPTPALAGRGYPPLHQAVTHIVGE